ncbi:protein OS-9 [Geosmithia morbida]|uniref:Endoplasmic reticulum lectin n=1 Tax=Geosmithia morbida TaxID=1094350 RepID=A0A9P5D3P1_9HYPO|nr:protein OS-9 [Geosmithia morbida]KAF4121985.1 protein OS-9 [Geosmithia morbida]
MRLALLAGLLQLSDVRARSFSVHDDLLAFPQFDVIFSDGWVSKSDAQALIKGEAPPGATASSSDLSEATAARSGIPEDEGGTDEIARREYKIMNLSSREYLCTIPVLQRPTGDDQTLNELAKAEEAKELSRATASGWELLGDLEGRCLYFGSGWWTYKFCKNREIVQFHAAAVNVPGQPPRRDPSTIEFVLGSVPTIPMSSTYNRQQQQQQSHDGGGGNEDGQQDSSNDNDNDRKPLPAEVQTKGEQRYLVQRLEAGTVCDLTGRERTIEVQYHCVPGLSDAKISWIKEVTICAYLMVVNTPHLCNDVAFLPPKETTANPISCQPIGGIDGQPLLDDAKVKMYKPGADAGAAADGDKTAAAAAADDDEGGRDDVAGVSEPDDAEQQPLPAPPQPKVVGGVVVGARHVLSSGDEDGKPPMELSRPKASVPKGGGPGSGAAADEGTVAELVAQAAKKAKGGKTQVMTPEQLEDLDVDPQVIAEMRVEVERLAGQAGWRIEIVDLPNDDREIRGYIDDEPEQAHEAEGDGTKKDEERQGQKQGDDDGAEGQGERRKDGSQEQMFRDRDEL